MKNIVHYGLHFVFPIIVALMWNRNDWRKVYLVLLLTMAVDLDHLVADPIFDPHRNSIGFHILHSYPAIAVYFLVFILGKGEYRLVALGLLLHMFTDFQDSMWNC